jgi:CRISPR system Cascade subunit CasE
VIDWLLRKGERGGFKPAQVKISTASPVYDVFIAPQGNRTGYPVRAAGSTQVGQTSDHKLTFYGVEFEGYLVVTDASKFVTTLQDGVGSGKAFGYGLLSIAPEHAQD